MTSSGDKKNSYEKLSPETMESHQGSGMHGYEISNKAIVEPQHSFCDKRGKLMGMHLDGNTSKVTKSDDKKYSYEKLNPETMESYQGYDRTCCENVEKATAEPQHSPCEPDE